MKCLHCGVEVHRAFQVTAIGNDFVGVDRPGGIWHRFDALSMQCPACSGAILHLRARYAANNREAWERAFFPRHAQRRASAAKEVPPYLAEDYDEAGSILDESPKASAALSRRCLQSLLRAQNYPQHDLAKQIDALLDAKVLPSGLAENVDAIRNIGNFAAHPLKDTNSGAILPVEPHEAEWNLEVLEGLFDFYYVAPARNAARKAALDAKLAAAGKPPMK